jgi:hypothetical protein
MNKRDGAEFDRNSFIRQSVHIPDGEDDYNSPRPPTMIESHKGAFDSRQQASFGNNAMYPVQPMPNIQPAPVANPFSTERYGLHPDQQQQQSALIRVPSNGSTHSYNGGVAISDDPMIEYSNVVQGQYPQYPSWNQNMTMEEHQGQGYADLRRTSVTPYQAAQYAEISRQLNFASAANSPVSPSFAQNQGYNQRPGFAPSMERVPSVNSIGNGRLPTPAPARSISPGRAMGGPERIMSPSQRVTSPVSVPVGGYSFPMPLHAGAPTTQYPLAAHVAAKVPYGTNAPARGLSEPQRHNVRRPTTVYDEDDAYGGM